MKYRLVQLVEGHFVVSEFAGDNVYPAMEVRGFAYAGDNANPRQRQELQHAPLFAGLCGPMWDGDAIRYETRAVYDRLSA
jgi:hypothetical protein